MRMERSALMLSSRVAGKVRSEPRNKRSKLVVLMMPCSSLAKCALFA
jgi:hypothetical protein